MFGLIVLRPGSSTGRFQVGRRVLGRVEAGSASGRLVKAWKRAQRRLLGTYW